MKLPNEGGAQVRFPPPLVFLGAILLGVVVQRMAVPLSLLFAPALGVTAGALILACGVSLVVSARILFKRTGQNPIPWKTTPELILQGPYRFTRNPMGGYSFCGRTWPDAEQYLDFLVRGSGARGGAFHRGVTRGALSC